MCNDHRSKLSTRRVSKFIVCVCVCRWYFMIRSIDFIENVCIIFHVARFDKMQILSEWREKTMNKKGFLQTNCNFLFVLHWLQMYLYLKIDRKRKSRIKYAKLKLFHSTMTVAATNCIYAMIKCARMHQNLTHSNKSIRIGAKFINLWQYCFELINPAQS